MVELAGAGDDRAGFLVVGDPVGFGGDLGEPHPREQRLHETSASVIVSWIISRTTILIGRES
jgi:hypothetical protein